MNLSDSVFKFKFSQKKEQVNYYGKIFESKVLYTQHTSYSTSLEEVISTIDAGSSEKMIIGSSSAEASFTRTIGAAEWDDEMISPPAGLSAENSSTSSEVVLPSPPSQATQLFSTGNSNWG